MQFKNLRLLLFLIFLLNLILYIFKPSDLILFLTIISAIIFVIATLSNLQIKVKVNINKYKAFTELQKDICKRHLQNKFTPFEIKVIKNILTDDFFPYYCLYSLNNNVWKALANSLIRYEKSNYSAMCDISISLEKEKKEFKPGIFFFTNLNRIIIIRQDNHLSANSNASVGFIVDMKEILDIDYNIDTRIITRSQTGIYSNSVIRLKNNTTVTLNRVYARGIELIKDIIYQNKYNNKLQPEEMIKDYKQRQVEKVEKAYYENSITKDNYEFLVQCAQYSFLDSNKQNFEKLKHIV